MKKFYKIILITVFVVLIIVGFVGYQVYKMTMGSEPLTGKLENIPARSSNVPPVNTGDSDWKNWRGNNFEGKSATKGILTDW
jgi:hypothetical protein